MNHPAVVKLTEHARQRCAEMGVSTKRVKRLVRSPTLTYVTYGEGRRVATSHEDPDIAVVYLERSLLVLTVLPNIPETYVRDDGPDGYHLALWGRM